MPPQAGAAVYFHRINRKTLYVVTIKTWAIIYLFVSQTVVCDPKVGH